MLWHCWPDSSKALNVLAGDSIQFRLYLDADDVGKGVHGGQQQGTSFAGAKIDECAVSKSTVARCCMIRQTLLPRWLIEAFAEHLAQAHGYREPGPGSVRQA